MQFLWPSMLALLLMVPVLVGVYVWALRRRARFALRYSSLSLLKNALEKGPGIRRHLPPLFFLLGTTIMLIAVARPQAVVTLPKEEATVILALDSSGSMRANDMKPNRFQAAKDAARKFIEKQDPNTRIGIVAFAGTASLVQAPTTDREALFAAMDRLRLQRATAIGSGIITALDAIFEDPADSRAPASRTDPLTEPTPSPTSVPYDFHAPAIIILLTDGQNNAGTPPLQAAQQAAARGVRVFTIGAGTTRGTTVQGSSGFGFRTELDENTLKEIARMTDGEYFHASDEQALVEIYQSLDTQVIVRTQRTEITAAFTGLATMFLLIGGALSLLWFNRLP